MSIFFHNLRESTPICANSPSQITAPNFVEIVCMFFLLTTTRCIKRGILVPSQNLSTSAFGQIHTLEKPHPPITPKHPSVFPADRPRGPHRTPTHPWPQVPTVRHVHHVLQVRQLLAPVPQLPRTQRPGGRPETTTHRAEKGQGGSGNPP